MLWDDDESMNPGSFVLGGGASALNMALPGALGMLGSIGSAILGGNSAKSANDQNRLTALYQMQFQKDEAQKAREWDATQNWSAIGWQEKMANTAYQRQIADMKAAGLNPILAATKGGGAATPGASGGGSHGSPQGASYRADPVYNAQLAQLSASAMQIAAQTKLLEAETRKTNVEADNLALQPEYIRSQILRETASAGAATATEAQIRQEMQSFEPRMKRLEYETEGEWYKAAQAKYKAGILNAEDLQRARRLDLEMDQIKADIDRTKAQAQLFRLEIPAAVNQAESQYNWYSKNVRPYIHEIISGAKALGTGAVGGALLRR